MIYNKQSTIKYYDTHAETYDNDGDYPADKIRLELVTDILKQVPKGKLLDAGCGTGQLLKMAHGLGFKCIGCDFSEGMLKKAKQTLTGTYVPIIQTSLDNLSMFKNGVFDSVFCLGVFPYIPEDEEGKAYQEMRRVIKPGGYFVTAHQNELFDLLTFNKYTVRFYERNILPLAQIINHDYCNIPYLDPELWRAEVAKLLTSPDQPINKDSKNSGRDIVFTKPENPVTYPDKLAKYGFTNKDFMYYNFHCLPPLLRNSSQEWIDISKKMEIQYSKTWQGMFMASTFISVAQAI